MNKKAVLEGILFIVGDEGTTLDEIKSILDINDEEVKSLLMELKKDYESNDRGLRISYLGNAFKLTTKEEHKNYYQKLMENPITNKLSQAALETLAIIAYNEPVTRIKVDELRGVVSSQIVRNLVAKGFIKEAGRSNMPGRPILYETTNEFLDYFGLSSKDDLPDMDEFIDNNEEEIDEDNNLYTAKYREENVD